jgi:hypothetical protein
MIEEPTCLILGAGASAPYGLPTIAQLRDLIISTRSPNGAATATQFRLRTPEKAWLDPGNAVAEWNIYLNEQTKAAGLEHKIADFWNKFYRADRSIDWFLRRNESMFGDIARLQIAAVLLACEQDDKLSDDWYQLLSQEILPRNLDSLEEGKLSIISFNYDRSFERYFLNQFENLCDFPPDEAKDALNKIRLEHAYGQLGSLDEVPYGNFAKAADAANGIRTIRLEPDKDVQTRLGKLIRESTYVNFIGFGFDDDNIELLGPKNFKDKRVYSTSFGLHLRTRNKANQILGVRFAANDPPQINAQQLFGIKDLFGPKQKPAPSRPRAPRHEDQSGRRSNV